MKRIDVIKSILSDGKSHKLKKIVDEVKEAGLMGTPSSQYISVYQILHYHPELFEKVRCGEYALRKGLSGLVKFKTSVIVEEIEEMLISKPYQTPAQIWRALLEKGIQITYDYTQQLMSREFLNDEYSRYFVE